MGKKKRPLRHGVAENGQNGTLPRDSVDNCITESEAAQPKPFFSIGNYDFYLGGEDDGILIVALSFLMVAFIIFLLLV